MKQSDKDQCHTFLMAAFLLLAACVVNCEYLLRLHTAAGDWLNFSWRTWKLLLPQTSR